MNLWTSGAPGAHGFFQLHKKKNDFVKIILRDELNIWRNQSCNANIKFLKTSGWQICASMRMVRFLISTVVCGYSKKQTFANNCWVVLRAKALLFFSRRPWHLRHISMLGHGNMWDERKTREAWHTVVKCSLENSPSFISTWTIVKVYRKNELWKVRLPKTTESLTNLISNIGVTFR